MRGSRFHMLLKQTVTHQDSQQWDTGTEAGPGVVEGSGSGLAISAYGKEGVI